MNNYSWLEQKLHEFALSSQFMREVTFDFESTNIAPSSEIGDHIFITGLPRSGTTSLLNFFYASNEFGSLKYKNMPFIFSPNFSKLLNVSPKLLIDKNLIVKKNIEVIIKENNNYEI